MSGMPELSPVDPFDESKGYMTPEEERVAKMPHTELVAEVARLQTALAASQRHRAEAWHLRNAVERERDALQTALEGAKSHGCQDCAYEIGVPVPGPTGLCPKHANEQIDGHRSERRRRVEAGRERDGYKARDRLRGEALELAAADAHGFAFLRPDDCQGHSKEFMGCQHSTCTEHRAAIDITPKEAREKQDAG